MSKKYLSVNSGDYPVYSSQTANEGVFGTIATYDFDGKFITWTTDGAKAGTVSYRNGKFSCTNVCGVLEVKDKNIDTKYLANILSIIAPKYVNLGMGNPKLMSNQRGNIQVPVRPLPEQKRVASILEKFEEISNNFVTGLPAEITARRKQYEYCRDKLLTFKKLED